MYGNLLYKYPVVANSVWQFEKGLLVCGSNQDANIQKLIPVVDSCYTDPPWNQGNMKMFYTYARRELEKSYFEFIENIIILLKSKVSGTVWMDIGIKQHDDVVDILDNHGWETAKLYTTYYGHPPRPLKTICGSFTGTGITANIEGLHGVSVIQTIMESLAFNNQTVFDPCCGKLDYLIEGIKQGMSYVYGIELIPKKLALGLSLVEKLGYKVKRVQ